MYTISYSFLGLHVKVVDHNLKISHHFHFVVFDLQMVSHTDKVHVIFWSVPHITLAFLSSFIS